VQILSYVVTVDSFFSAASRLSLFFPENFLSIVVI